MEINFEKLAEECIKAINDKVRNLKTLNIIVAGKTGVGKSTLINGVFRENLAETGKLFVVVLQKHPDILCPGVFVYSFNDIM